MLIQECIEACHHLTCDLIQTGRADTFCMGLPRYKRPRKVILAHVPRNPTGKIEKPLLRKIYRSENLVAQQNEIEMDKKL